MNPFTDDYFMKQALAEARMAAEEGEIPVGAIVACRDQIIARAHNQTERLNDPTAHAEMLAITAATNLLGAKYLTDCTLYVTLEPCVMCAGAIGWSQISMLTYGASDEKRGFQRYAPHALHPKTAVKKGVMEEACADLMKNFFRDKRKPL
ncbi:MAG: nucleoside deaminase [Tannerella sp.]|jgi:tRNA(adenine34) deaminase|nr:nucleoside deaminase [Tannerella sp.]